MRKTSIVVGLLLVVALAVTIAALWRGGRQEIVVPDGRAAITAPGETNPERAAEAVTREPRPGDDTNGPAHECAELLTSAEIDIAAERSERHHDETMGRADIEIDLSENVHIVARLALSDDPDHRLAAVLMTRNRFRRSNENVEAIAGILERHPDHKLAFWNLLLQCAGALEHPACSDASLSARAEKIDKENSEIWALLAVYRERRNDYDGAVTAMQRAIGSASTSVYYAEQILLFERAYTAASDYGRSVRAVRAFGEAAAQPMQHVEVYGACKRLAKKDLLWRRMCVDYGHNLASRARSLMGEVFGLSLQIEIAMMEEDDDKVRELNQRIDSLREFNVRDDFGTIFDDQFNARYLEELSVNGERAALAFLRSEIERRRELHARCR